MRPRINILDQWWSRYAPSSERDHNTLTGRLTAEISVEFVVEQIPGENGEHKFFEDRKWGPGRYRQKAWKEFKEDIQKRGIEYKPLIMVDFDRPHVTLWEGNHRFRAAYQLGMDSIVTEIKYMGHAECAIEVPWTYPPSVQKELNKHCQKSTFRS